MRNTEKQFITISLVLRQRRQRSGFSLVEMLIAMAVFLIVGGAAVKLVGRHVPLFTTSQNQVGVNIAMRNALSQLETDVSNAGNGFLPGANVSLPTIGMTIIPAPTPVACKATGIYVAACFDRLAVLTVDNITVPIATPNGNAAGTLPVNTAAGGSVYLTFSPTPNAATLATIAAAFSAGDEILLVKSAAPHTMAPLVLSANGVVTGTTVQLTFNPFDPAASGSDPLNIFDASSVDIATTRARFSTAFGGLVGGQPVGDYAIRLVPTFYNVDTTIANNPRLTRTQGFAGNPDVIAEQIIGFQVAGWSTLVGGTGGYSPTPNLQPSPTAPIPPIGGYNSDWSTLRSLQVSLLARTPGGQDDRTHSYVNSYDGGNYQVQAASAVINPRNLSMTHP